MTTKVQDVRQKAAAAQTELERVIVEETDDRPALVLRVDPVAEKTYLVRRTTRNVSDVEESTVEIFDDELDSVTTILSALKKTV